MEFEIKTNLTPAEMTDAKLWGRFPNAWNKEANGGFALGGERAFPSWTSPGTLAFVSIVKAPFVYLAFTVNQKRYGFLFEAGGGGCIVFSLAPSLAVDITTKDATFLYAFTDFEVMDSAGQHLTYDAFRNTRNIPHYPGFHNPHYACAVYLHHVKKLPLITAPQEGPKASPVASPLELATRQEFSQFEKASDKLAVEYNMRFPLPDGMKFRGTLSGIWLVSTKDGRLDLLGAVVSRNLEQFTTLAEQKGEPFRTLIQEQISLLSGASALLGILLLGENYE